MCICIRSFSYEAVSLPWSHLIFMAILRGGQGGYFIQREPDAFLFETSKPKYQECSS